MFFVFAIASMAGYALQGTLLAHYARRIDGLSLAFYRNISFAVTLLPLLAGATAAEVAQALSYWRELVVSGISGSLYLALLFTAYRSVPVGVALTFNRAATTVVMTLLGTALFAEVLPPATVVIIGVIVLTSLWLGLQRNHMPHLNNTVAIGIGLALLGAVPVSLTKVSLTQISRVADPLVSGYFWELSIAVACGLIVLLRWCVRSQGLQRIDWRTFGLIALCSSPTLIGTGAFALAVREGAIGVVSAIGSTSLVLTSLLAWWWYGEKLHTRQWAGMAVILAAMVFLKFV